MDRHNELYEYTEHSEESYQKQQEEQVWADIKLTEECMKEEAKAVEVFHDHIEGEGGYNASMYLQDEPESAERIEYLEKLGKDSLNQWIETLVQESEKQIWGEKPEKANGIIDRVTTTDPDGIQKQHQVVVSVYGSLEEVVEHLKGIKNSDYKYSTWFNWQECVGAAIEKLQNTIDKGYYIQEGTK